MNGMKEKFKDKKAYIFDLFHTLTSLESVKPNLPSTSEYLGIDRKTWNDLLINSSPDRLCGRERDPFTIIRKLVDQVNPAIPDEIVCSAARNRMERFAQALLNIPKDTIKTLKELKKQKITLGLLSNADVMEIAQWENSPLASCFDSVVFSCWAGFAKPDREIYGISLKELRVKAEEAVFIGDGGSDELAGAKRIGLCTVLVTGIAREIWPDKIAERRKWADWEIVHIRELLE
jgi:putative hydrolase of the HAD superfamily